MGEQSDRLTKPSGAPVDVRPADAWNQRYLSGDTPWDTGVVPPEVIAFVSSGTLRRGWALDLGCGSGVSTCYLARQGFRAIGVDLAHSALVRAFQAAAADHLPAYFCLGDVCDLSFLRVRADFALDVGCLHGAPAARRTDYIRSLADHLLPDAFYLLYAFLPDHEGGPGGIGPGDLASFAPQFVLRWAQHGLDRTRPSAWYLLQRTQIL